MFAFSSLSRCSQAAWSGPVSAGSARSASATQYSAWRRAIRSPRSARPAARARTRGSSRASRRATRRRRPPRRTRLFSASEPTPPSVSMTPSPQTASTARSRPPPAKTDRRARSACSSASSSSWLQSIVSRSAAGRALGRADPLGDLGGGEQPYLGSGELDRERQPVEAAADLLDRLAIRLVEAEVRVDGLGPLDEEIDRAAAPGATAPRTRARPRCRAPARLVASTRSRGAASSSSASAGAAAVTCSRLSSTSRSCLSRR